MKNDKELLKKLNDQFIVIKDKLGATGGKVCQKELSHLQSLFERVNRPNSAKTAYLKSEESPFLEIILALKNIMKCIDDEERLLEKEMRGVENYSHYEYTNTVNFAYKKDLKEELIKMLLTIRAERPELKGKEPFISI